ncbi:hypothetical protein EZV62_008851 [Acer yangbiense]|uniref:RRM domain-containing protein n=1 Tax=Acer yangbiense TaxID=1000413 RepID=A0A5C7IGJ7_9ROSI|nr:hypothetical protein EZV62_008851 [Acer yangbiense]
MMWKLVKRCHMCEVASASVMSLMWLVHDEDVSSVASLGPPPTALSMRLSMPMAILESQIINDRETGRSRGFKFVTFRDEKAMRDAIEGMNGQNLDGRNITVNEAQSRGSRNSGGGGGGYGGSHGGGERNGVYVYVVDRVREAFKTEEVVRLDCSHAGTNDCKKIGVKLRDLVPCVPILFKDEQIILWRGKKDQELDSVMDPATSP